jgi:hypothetical protein
MRAAVYCPWPNSVSHTFTCTRTDMKRPPPLCRHTDAMNLRENTEEILTILFCHFYLFYSVILSITCYFPPLSLHFITIITAIFRLCQLCKALQRVVRTAQYITGAKLPAIQDLYTRRCQRKALKIVKDPSHPSHRLFSLLQHGKWYRTAPSLGPKCFATAFTPKP